MARADRADTTRSARRLDLRAYPSQRQATTAEGHLVGYRSLRLVDVLEAAYGAAEQRSGPWLEAVLESVRPALDQGLGVQGYIVDASQPGTFRTSGFCALGADATAVRSAFERWDREVPADFKRRVHTFAPFGVGSALPQDITGPPRDHSLAVHGFPEVLGVNGLDATMRGCAIAATSPRAMELPDRRVSALWGRVAVHLATAARIHRRLVDTRSSDVAEAVLEPGGKVVDATGAARDGDARLALRTAAKAVDRARSGAERADNDATVHLWQALVARRWSLVDDFEADGRRYLLAIPNRPHPDPRGPLSAREREVLGALALGHGNKLIAYELGLSPSSVATHVARAAAKLGVEGREALVRLLAIEPGVLSAREG